MTESGNMTETQDADVFIMVRWKFWADCYIHLQPQPLSGADDVSGSKGNLSLLFIVMKVTV
jgi:hypothetical protein